PSNMASGLCRMSYPFLRFWFRHDKDSFTELMNHAMRHGIRDWHDAECVLIAKASKPRYDVAKAWRMIHLLPVMAKVAERVMLGRIEKELRLEGTQYGSRKRRSCQDAVGQIAEFLEHNKGMKRMLLSMDIEGGFDKI